MSFRFVQLYLIGQFRFWWMHGLISHDNYDWLLSAIQADAQDIYDSPFFE